MLTALIDAFTFILAQNGDGDGGTGAGSYTIIIYIVLFIGIFYFLLIRPGQKQRKVHQEIMQATRSGDEVMTAGGIYGKVAEEDDDFVMLEIADNVVIKVSRNSIARRMSAEASLDQEQGEVPEEPQAGTDEDSKKE